MAVMWTASWWQSPANTQSSHREATKNAAKTRIIQINVRENYAARWPKGRGRESSLHGVTSRRTSVLIKFKVTETEVWICDLEWIRWRQDPRESLCKHGCTKTNLCISFITRNRTLWNTWKWENINTARCRHNGRSDTVAFLSECFSFITRKSLCYRVWESR